MNHSSPEKVMYIIFTTESDRNNAYKIANLLLNEKLIACIAFKDIESHFWWEEEIKEAKEVQLTIKCKEENINKVCNKISEYHSYEIPEIIYFPVSAKKNYFDWINSVCT